MKKTIIAVLALAFVGLGFVFVQQQHQQQEAQALKEQEALRLQVIAERFSESAIINKDTSLFQLVDGQYVEKGQIAQGVAVRLEQEAITLQTQYFKIANLDAYVAIEDVDARDTPVQHNQAYQRYVVFNENVKTKETTSFYDAQDQWLFSLEASFDLPIIINEKDRVGVEFDQRLLYVKDIESRYAHDNSTEETRTNIRSFLYHTVYDKDTQSCTSIEICHTIEQFGEHMRFLHEEGFVTLTMEEVELFLDGKIRIPLKTVAITLDDGIFLENSIPIVEQYEIYATFFIITSKTDVTPYMNSPYARFESHTDDLHNNYRCPKNTSYSQGGQMLCEPYDSLVKDLKLSQEKLGGSNYFAYPFFDVNDHAKAALREAGFHFAMIGEYNTNGYSDASTDRMMIRRKTIFGNFSLEVFSDYCFGRD